MQDGTPGMEDVPGSRICQGCFAAQCQEPLRTDSAHWPRACLSVRVIDAAPDGTHIWFVIGEDVVAWLPVQMCGDGGQSLGSGRPVLLRTILLPGDVCSLPRDTYLDQLCCMPVTLSPI